MINQNPIASEAIFSAAYVENYIDSVENLPDDVQRQLSRIRDIDVQYRSHLRDVDRYHELWKTLENSGADNTLNRRARAIARMQVSLIRAQERGDEKMQIVNQLQEIIDQKTRQLDLDQRNLDIKEEQQLPLIDNDDVAPTPPKILRSQSPIRDVLTNTDASSMGDVSVASEYVSNETMLPTERTSHNLAVVGAISCSGNGMQNSTSAQASNGSTSESQRSSTGKRSRRRHDTVNSQSQIDSICGNESNSASNEAGGSSSGADKITLNNSGSMQHKITINAGNATQKKPSLHCQVNAGGVLGAGNNGIAPSGSGTSTGATGSVNSCVKKKKRKARGAHAANSHNTREDTPPPDPDPIDPDEPTYCLCDQISFGEMILCDNDLCPIEWFHFSCVSLILKPKGKWYCPNCRGDRPNIMKPKAQFLKELERYNKEKEEKT